ncbi:MAG TPA: hypothetical protein VJ521_06770 [Acidobacteriota bacterium]|nr:hypothetical protein [Acidobacteriota bacterium]
MRNIPDERLVVYVIWLPILRSDDRKAADANAKESLQSRIFHYWDENRITGTSWQKKLGIPVLAWDIYLLYQPTALWEDDIPSPDFWMHQLRQLETGRPLDQAALEAKVKELLEK